MNIRSTRFILKDKECQNQASTRNALIRKNIALSFLLKAWSALVIFLLVPYTLKTLGELQNGVWLTISSLLLWIEQMDIGLGNGLRNKLAAFMAVKDYTKAQEALSSAFAILVVAVLPLAILLLLLTKAMDIYSIFNVSPTTIGKLRLVMTVSIVLVSSTFVLKLIGNFYQAIQLPAINNLMVVMGQSITLILTMVIYYSGIRYSLLSIAIANTLPPLIVYFAGCAICFWGKYRFLRPTIKSVKSGMAKELLKTGILFFCLQIAGGVLFLTSNLLITKLFSPNVITPYQITYRYFSLALTVFTVICVPYWSATTEAYKLQDMDWIKKSNTTLNRLVAFILVAIFLMILISPIFYSVWVGTYTHVSMGMTIMMAIYMTICIVSLRYSFILNGLGALRIQLITTTAAAICFIPSAIFISKLTGNILCLMAVMSAVNIPGLYLNYKQFHKIINHQAKGIWLK